MKSTATGKFENVLADRRSQLEHSSPIAFEVLTKEYQQHTVGWRRLFRPAKTAVETPVTEADVVWSQSWNSQPISAAKKSLAFAGLVTGISI